MKKRPSNAIYDNWIGAVESSWGRNRCAENGWNVYLYATTIFGSPDAFVGGQERRRGEARACCGVNVGLAA